MQLIRIIVLLSLFCAFCLNSQAGIKPNRFNQRENVLSSKRFERKSANLGKQQSSIGSQTWTGSSTWSRPNSQLLQKRAPIAIQETRNKKHYKTSNNKHVQDKRYSYQNQTQHLNTIAAYNDENWRDNRKSNSRFNNTDTIYLEELDHFGRKQTSAENRLSMQDINRFAFRKNHSTAEGFNTERAASEEPRKTQENSQ